MDIGNKLRDLRMQKGLTQEELADRAELSKGFISQMERNQTSPSIATLLDVLQCLGTNVSDFFREEEEDPVVFRKEDFFEKKDPELKNTIEWIVPNSRKHVMEPILLTLEKGGSSYPDVPHEGEEFGYVLSGSVTVCIGTRRIRVKKGETFYFTPDKEHYITSAAGASLLWVSSPPNF